MLKVRYHEEKEYNLSFEDLLRLEGKHCHHPLLTKDISQGIIVLEALPQKRVMFGIERDQYERNTYRHLVDLPNLFFVINYNREKSNYTYEKLRIFVKPETISTESDIIYVSPTELEQGYHGFCCTPHEYDYKCYKDLKTLCSELIGVWYGLYHQNVFKMIRTNFWKDYFNSAKFLDEINNYTDYGKFISVKSKLSEILKIKLSILVQRDLIPDLSQKKIVNKSFNSYDFDKIFSNTSQTL
jgi:hypothetical protein